MIIQPFFFGNVDGDLATEFVEVEEWANTVLGQQDVLEENNVSIIPSVATTEIPPDSRLFIDGYHLQTLLNSIDNAYPFLFFILGDTYGTVYSEFRQGKGERNMEVSADLGHNWLLDKKIKQASLLNILIQYATLKSAKHNKSKHDSDSEGRPSPFIYIRRPTYERSVHLMTENGRFAHQRAPSILADAVRMDSLKREILGNDLRMRFFDTPEQLITSVFADFQRCVRLTRITAQSNIISTPTLNHMMEELSKRVHFDKNDDDDDDDDDNEPTNEQRSGKIIALVSEPRSGKHRLLYSWLSNFSETNPGIPLSVFDADPDVPIFEMNSVVFLMNNAIKTFRSFHKEFDRSVVEGRVMQCLEARNLQETEQEFGASLALGPCLLVIMGLDVVSCGRYFGGSSEVKVKQLEWLPQVIPPNCIIIVTTTSNDMTMKSLLKRNDVEVVEASNLAKDDIFKETFLRSQCVALGKFPQYIFSKILAAPSSSSSVHLAAVGHILANEDMLHRLEFQVESILELTRLRDLFTHELRKWVFLSSNTPPTSATPSQEETDRTTTWVPGFLRFMVLSRYGMPTRLILHFIKLSTGLKKHGQHQKILECWWAFWQAAKYIFTAAPRNTIKLISENVRRGLSVVIFDSEVNTFAVWRRRYVRFLRNVPGSATDPIITDELIVQADQSDDFASLLRLLSNANSFSRVVCSSLNMEVFAASILNRMESNTSGLFRYLVARWLNGLGVLCDSFIAGGDSTDRSTTEETMSQMAESSSNVVVLPEDTVKRCDFAWLICDWLFAITRITPNDVDHTVTVNAFSGLIPLVVRFCENELAHIPFDVEAHARLAGFLMRCSARFAAPRFNNMKLALEMMKQAAKICFEVDNVMTNKLQSDVNTDQDLGQLMEKIDPNLQNNFQKYIRYSFICAQLEACEMYFKLGDMEEAQASMSAVEPFIRSQGSPTWPPIVCANLFCLSLFSHSSTDLIERFLRVSADTSTKWYGKKHPAVADTLLALGCILASRATTPKPAKRAMSAKRIMSANSRHGSRPSTAIEGLQQVFDSLFSSEEVEQCFREAIAILEERRLSAGGDTERLSFACASLGRFLSNSPISSAKREAVELLQKAGDLALLEKGQEDYSVKWLRNLTKNTLLAMPPVWFVQLSSQQQAEDAASLRPIPSSRQSCYRPISSRLQQQGLYPEVKITNDNINTRPRPMTTQCYRRPQVEYNCSKPLTSSGRRSTFL